MSYRVTVSVNLGLGETGVVLNAQLIDTSGSNVGSLITTGFVEVGNGTYLWDYSLVPDDFRGGVVFTDSGTSEVVSIMSLSPEDVELIGEILSGVGSITVPDPLENQVPGSYSPGEAGYVLGQLAGVDSVGSLAPVITDAGDVELVKGQDYLTQTDNPVSFSNSEGWPNLANATVVFHAFGSELDMEVVADSGTQVVTLDLDDLVTVDLPLNRYAYSVVAQLSDGSKHVLAKGRVLFS